MKFTYIIFLVLVLCVIVSSKKKKSLLKTNMHPLQTKPLDEMTSEEKEDFVKALLNDFNRRYSEVKHLPESEMTKDIKKKTLMVLEMSINQCYSTLQLIINERKHRKAVEKLKQIEQKLTKKISNK